MNATLAANLLYFPITRLGGERVRAMLREYKAHDKLTQSHLSALQLSALFQLMTHAQQHSPFYASRLPELSPSSSSSRDPLEGVPPLKKDDLRENLDAIRVTNLSERVESKTTSGSTGHPLTLLKNADALARERAATLRSYSWAGILPAAPQAMLWGLPHTQAGRRRARLLDFFANRRRLSVFGVTDVDMLRFHRAIWSFRPHYLYGYVSAVVMFMRLLEKSELTLPPSVRCIVTTSEILDSESRRFIERSSGRRVFNEYGCGEVGSIAHECEMGRLHVMSDNLIVEVSPRSDMPSGLGDLLVTDLYNKATPLIRYRVGDLGELSDSACPCGRPYPVLKRVVGRAYDVIRDNSGVAYHPEAVLYVLEDLRRDGWDMPPCQAIQTEDGLIELVVETNDGIPRDFQAAAELRFSEAFGSRLKLQFGRTAKLEREPSGKLRVVRRA